MPDFPADVRLLLGSRSPRRLELLSVLVPREQITVAAPVDEAEPGFEGLTALPEILDQLQSIARLKCEAVLQEQPAARSSLVLTADTTVIAEPADGPPAVLGKPDGPDWQATVREWFERYYFGQTHQVATAVCLHRPDGRRHEFKVLTDVRFVASQPELLEWYIRTGEPLGKAGGYGMQGAGGMFVESVTGSLSNVIGLPLEATWQALQELHT